MFLKDENSVLSKFSEKMAKNEFNTHTREDKEDDFMKKILCTGNIFE